MAVRVQHSCATALLSLGLIGAAACASAQELEPRAYANTPIGVNFVVSSYGYSEGGLATDPSIPLDNAKLRIDTVVLAYARSFSAWSRSAKFDVVLPYASLSGTADVAGQPRERNVSDWADARARISINLYGAPAQSLQEAASFRQDLIVGASLQLTAPSGQYDSDKLVNLGTNRWTVKPELGVSKAAGRWTLELAAAASFYEDNDDFFGGRRREQEPIYSLQGLAIYNFPGGVWAALGATYYTGGRTTVDGIRGNDLQENTRVGAIVTLPLNRHNSIKLYANTGVATRTGTDFDTAGIAWQYRWGGGL
jgi:hypothetical protein